jgi:hypothetical protein
VLILQKKTKKPAPSRPIKKVFFDDPPISDEDEDGDGDLLLLSPLATGRPTSLLDLSNDEASYLGTGTATPLCPSVRGAAPTPASDSVLLLDLEALDSLTPPRREHSLPQLVTFSPMDDL